MKERKRKGKGREKKRSKNLLREQCTFITHRPTYFLSLTCYGVIMARIYTRRIYRFTNYCWAIPHVSQGGTGRALYLPMSCMSSAESSHNWVVYFLFLNMNNIIDTGWKTREMCRFTNYCRAIPHMSQGGTGRAQ